LPKRVGVIADEIFDGNDRLRHPISSDQMTLRAPILL